MTVTMNHHAAAEKLYKDGRATREVREILMGTGQYLTKSQANSCCKTARKHLGIYVSQRKIDRANAKVARDQAHRLAEEEKRNKMHRDAQATV